jgi:hypothetical protein
MIRASDLPEDRKVRLAAAKEKEIAAARPGISRRLRRHGIEAYSGYNQPHVTS